MQPFQPNAKTLGFSKLNAADKTARGIKGVLAGKSGIGKTSQLWTLDPESTLFIDLEAGDLAVQGWTGDVIQLRTWPECRDLAALIGGPDPALRADQAYSSAHHQSVCSSLDCEGLSSKYQTFFIDSITVASRLCLQWCRGQPQALSDRSGKPDLRAAYGLLGQEMIAWLTHLRHAREKNIWLVGILETRLDDFNRPQHGLQIEGSKTALELPGIVDELITLTDLKADDGTLQRTFVCQTVNPWGFPAKDRSGRLSLTEPADLGKLMQKIRAPASASSSIAGTSR